MVIKSSNVAMASTRTYTAKKIDLQNYSGWGNVTTANSTLPTAKDSVQKSASNVAASVSTSKKEAKETKSTKALSVTIRDLLAKLEEEQKSVAGSRRVNSLKGDDQDVLNTVEFNTFQNLIELLFGVRNMKRMPYSRLEEMLSSSNRDSSSVTNYSGVTPTQTWGASYKEYHYFEEKEQTSFYSSGKVTTADGRSIDFDVEAYMSRTFMEETSFEVNYKQAATVDPLVINFSSNMVDVSDQTFLFDLDCDGELDNLSLLGQLSGFLSLDRNGDGIINDGSELFGARTGDGFKELAVFDMDGNGWIDESDEVFNQLRIWTKDKDGNDRLVGLGVAGIGAIYLGNVQTNFSIHSQEDNELLAQVRTSGVFLKESGEAGTIQQVDMALRERSAS